MLSNQTRTLVATPNTWTAINIPVGATDFVLGVETNTSTFRIAVDNTLDPSTQGLFVAATCLYSHEGTTTAQLTIYLSASVATFAILQYN